MEGGGRSILYPLTTECGRCKVNLDDCTCGLGKKHRRDAECREFTENGWKRELVSALVSIDSSLKTIANKMAAAAPANDNNPKW